MATNDNIKRDDDKADANRDPISGSPGAHPVGVGLGAAGGGAAAAAAGAAIGAAVSGPAAPIGAVVGAVVGAVGGGYAGKGVAESINPTEEDNYWRENHRGRNYVDRDADYDRDLAPAYRAGYTAAPQHQGRRFEDVESDLGRNWESSKDQSRLSWDRAKHASRDAYQRASDKLGQVASSDTNRNVR
ncbi:MAG TPA: hypothetical protein VGN72_23780 [Tepidisphaeraceae bacterium]|jgi:hypothetical protein|nr:hypothetical protein [Tepidisphaeraceae bacterium]